jgi:hypothetical protein
MLIRFYTFLLLAFGGCSLAAGQACNGTETLEGVVQDADGALLPNAAIQLVATDGATAMVSSDRKGAWRAACLKPGSYSYEIHASGFRDSAGTVQVGMTGERVPLLVRMKLDVVKETVEVGNEQGLTGDGGTVISGRVLEGLANDPDDLLRQLQALAGTAGAIPGNAIVTVDGFQNSSGLPPKSSIREVRISPDMFSAEYTSPPYAGARIEVFTKAGQDTFHGATFGDFSPQAFNASAPLSLSASPASRQRYGGDFSGPLGSGKHANFAFSLEHRRISENAVVLATVLSPSGTATSFGTTVPAPQRLWQGNARAGWQLGTKDTLTVSFAATNNVADNRGAGGLMLPEVGYSSQTTEYTLRAVNTTMISSQLLHSLRVGYSWKGLSQTPNSSAAQINVSGAFVAGGSTNGNLADRERDLEVDDEVYLTHKAHSIKAGVQLLGTSLNDRRPDLFNGIYTFGGGDAPVLDASGLPTGGTEVINGLEQYRRTLANEAGGTPTTYSQTFGNLIVPLQQWTVGLYVQDDWKLTKRNSVSGGIRYFAQTAPDVVATVAPRLGWAVNLGHESGWTLHVRTGLFYSPIGVSTTLEALRLDGTRQQNTTVYSPNFNQPLASASTTAQIMQQRRYASGIGITPSSQSQIGLDHTIFKSWSLSGNVYYTASWRVLRSTNVNAPVVFSSTMNPSNAIRPFGPDLNIFEYGQHGHFSGPYAYFGVNHFSQRFSVFGGYLYNGFRSDADTPDTFTQSAYQHTADKARPTGDDTHSLFAVFLYSLPLKIASTVNLSAGSGSPYDITTGFDNNGDGVFNDRPSSTQAAGPNTYATPFGFLTTTTINGNLPRNLGTTPATVHLDVSLNREISLKRKKSQSKRQSTLEIDTRVTNLINHTNYTGVEGVLGTSQFTSPISADLSRRIELGVRYSF